MIVLIGRRIGSAPLGHWGGGLLTLTEHMPFVHNEVLSAAYEGKPVFTYLLHTPFEDDKLLLSESETLEELNEVRNQHEAFVMTPWERMIMFARHPNTEVFSVKELLRVVVEDVKKVNYLFLVLSYKLRKEKHGNKWNIIWQNFLSKFNTRK